MNAEPEKKGEKHPLRSEDPEEIPVLPKDRSEEGKRNEIKSGVPDPTLSWSFKKLKESGDDEQEKREPVDPVRHEEKATTIEGRAHTKKIEISRRNLGRFLCGNDESKRNEGDEETSGEEKRDRLKSPWEGRSGWKLLLEFSKINRSSERVEKPIRNGILKDKSEVILRQHEVDDEGDSEHSCPEDLSPAPFSEYQNKRKARK